MSDTPMSDTPADPIRTAGPTLDLAVIGNGMLAALVDRSARIVWSCFPRFDGDPVFCSLMTGADDPEHGGEFAIEVVDARECNQRYEENTAILVSEIVDARGNVVEVVDFAPRFRHLGRIFRPPQLVRRIRPLRGRPRVRIRVRPRFEWGARTPEETRGSHHLRFVGPQTTLRLTTDAPISYVSEGTPFALDRPLSFFFGTDEPLRTEVDETAREFLEKTVDYWRDWVRALSIPYEWQNEVIRAAITLKLCQFEETGAIVAALTTSIPEAPDSGRNWDYRFCWLRDAYFVIQALNRLGTTLTMEDFLGFITNIVDDAEEPGRPEDLPPLFGITRAPDLDERTAPALRGYRGMGPVRVGNAAATQIQNDVYGSVVLASTHAFLDRRMVRPGNRELFVHLEKLGRRAVRVFDQPDAGPWELRTKAAVHTFSSVMCWAACDRLARIAAALGDGDRHAAWQADAQRMRAVIEERAFNHELGVFVSTFDGHDLDATLLLLAELGFVRADDPRFVATVEAVGTALRRGDLLLRYAVEDDFGHMRTGFLICGFWYVDALASIGRRDEARALFERILKRRNSFGILSEDADVETGELWGNFPQTYSMVGIINAAMRLSVPWDTVI